MPHHITNRKRSYRTSLPKDSFFWEGLNASAYIAGAAVFVIGSVFFLPAFEKIYGGGGWVVHFRFVNLSSGDGKRLHRNHQPLPPSPLARQEDHARVYNVGRLYHRQCTVLDRQRLVSAQRGLGKWGRLVLYYWQCSVHDWRDGQRDADHSGGNLSGLAATQCRCYLVCHRLHPVFGRLDSLSLAELSDTACPCTAHLLGCSVYFRQPAVSRRRSRQFLQSLSGSPRPSTKPRRKETVPHRIRFIEHWF